jgi:hypothetical protein
MARKGGKKMDKKFSIVLTAFISVAVALSTGILVFGEEDSPSKSVYTENESREIAKEFVLNSPTYKFDGSGLEYKETLYPDAVGCEDCWTFVFEFESSHGGYGDRTGKIVTQVITPHEAHVTVENGEVVSASLDSEWNMLSQEMIDE